jgi:hypothetical protein
VNQTLPPPDRGIKALILSGHPEDEKRRQEDPSGAEARR